MEGRVMEGKNKFLQIVWGFFWVNNCYIGPSLKNNSKYK